MQPCHRMTSSKKICSVYRKQKEEAVMYKQMQVLLFDGVMYFTLFPKVCVQQGLFTTCKGCGCDCRDCMQVKWEWSHIDCGRTLGKLLARSGPAWKVITKLDCKNMLEQEAAKKGITKSEMHLKFVQHALASQSPSKPASTYQWQMLSGSQVHTLVLYMLIVADGYWAVLSRPLWGSTSNVQH